MKFTGDYHMHTTMSDGHTSVKGHVLEAKRRGIEEIAITDHSFTTLCKHMTLKKFERQREQINAENSRDVKILRGVEGNLIGGKVDVPVCAMKECDILLVGFHRFIEPSKMMGQHKFLMRNGFGSKSRREKMIEENTKAYIYAIEHYPVDVIAHLGFRAMVDFERVCKCAAEHDVYVELNVKHLNAIEDGIDAAIASGVNFIVGSDAHRAEDTGDFRCIEQFIIEHNIPIERVFGIDGRSPKLKDKKAWNYDI